MIPSILISCQRRIIQPQFLDQFAYMHLPRGVGVRDEPVGKQGPEKHGQHPRNRPVLPHRNVTIFAVQPWIKLQQAHRVVLVFASTAIFTIWHPSDKAFSTISFNSTLPGVPENHDENQ